MGARARPLSPAAAVGGVFVVALAVRLAIVIRSGGFLGNYGYDSGVYYAAADAFIHGRLPYRDFVLLHPPGLMLVLTPAALLGRLTTDHIGFLGANLGFTVIGAANAALVVLVARRIGLSTAAAVAGGLFYAVWLGSASAEYLGRLEPLGNLFLLLGLYAVVGLGRSTRDHDGEHDGRLLLLGGAAFGLAASVKIWFVLPLLVTAGWLLFERRSIRPASRFVLGAVLAGVIVDGPFLILAPGHMWSMVVTAQLGRPRAAVATLTRLGQLVSLGPVTRHLAPSAIVAVLVVVGVVAIALLIAAWRVRGARLIVLLAVAQVGMLLVSPSWFRFYADFAAVPVALCVATGVAALPRRARYVAWLPTAAAAGLTTAVLAFGSAHATVSWHGAGRLIHIVARDRCVMSDAPNGLIELNALDRDLDHRCPDWVDVTGHTYLGSDRQAVPRKRNQPWQHDLRRYLDSGQAVFLVRTGGDGMSVATLRAIERHAVVTALGPYRFVLPGPPSAAARVRG